jgi:3-oxoacyl-[acyl-carrier-protein] synthase-3
MTTALQGLTDHLLWRLRRVLDVLGLDPDAAAPGVRFADLLDSMALVEFLVTVADDCGVAPEEVERCVGRRFGTVGELAAAMEAAGLVPGGQDPALGPRPVERPRPGRTVDPVPCWLAATAACLPRFVQTAAALNEALGRPAGWLEAHAGITRRRVWGDQDPVAIAASAARQCLDRAGLLIEQVGALLVTSEAPPVYPGLAAALHHRLDLRPDTVALDVGGACTGYLAALWTARAVLAQVGVALVVALEAPTRRLEVKPGPAGEAAALFGDAAAASVLCQHPPGPEAVPVAAVVSGVDGGAAGLIRLDLAGPSPALHFEGEALASRALRAMAETVRGLVQDHGLTLADLEAVVAHGGNGRMPALLARALELPTEKVWSGTEEAGNLGSASLPVAWAARRPPPQGPVAWVAVGAGLTWAGALTGIG